MNAQLETHARPGHPESLIAARYRGCWCRLFITLLALGWAATVADARASSTSWHYRLIEGSTWTDDCLICGRPTLLFPLSGEFTLVLLEETPLTTRYEIQDLQFHTGTEPDTDYHLSGSGVLEVGGEVALRQVMRLDLHIEYGGSTLDRLFTNEVTTLTRQWPMIDIPLLEVEGTPIQTFGMVLHAAPLREIWFSTVNGMTSGNSDPPLQSISSGDVLSADGRVVRTGKDLVGKLGFMPLTPGVDIDAIDVQPGGEVWFSLGRSMFSETLGMLQEGDLLSDRGRIIKRNQELVEPFQFDVEPEDLGLDAVHVLPDGEIWFSLRGSAYSERLGVTVTAGDLLSDLGYIVHSEQELLANFVPADPKTELGLDALYVWPNGEIWFSVETNFMDAALGPVQAGDLLSNQGFVVARNLGLTLGFAPVEDLADFGLDALYLVSDLSPPAPTTALLASPRLTETGDITLEWTASSRVFRIERATEPAGPYLPVSPIVPAASWVDQRNAGDQAAFYRVREW